MREAFLYRVGSLNGSERRCVRDLNGEVSVILFRRSKTTRQPIVHGDVGRSFLFFIFSFLFIFS